MLRAKDLLTNTQRASSRDYANTISRFEESRDLFNQLGDNLEAGIAEIGAAQYLPDVAKIAESRQRLLALIASAEDRKFKILLPPAYYWLAVADIHQGQISDSNKHLRVALQLAEATENAFELQHVQDQLAGNYCETDELDVALIYAGKMLSERELYYQNKGQYWREKGTLSLVSIKFGFVSCAVDLAKESLAIARETWPDQSQVSDALTHLIYVATAKRDSLAALQYATESMQIARKHSNSAENIRTTANINLMLADLKSQEKDCGGALVDYEQALELYSSLPEVTDALYNIHKGRLFCFQELNQQAEFAVELKTVLALSEKYRATIREDAARQAFFASQQVVYDAAATSALRQHDSQQAFAFVEASKARSLLDFVRSEQTIVELEKNFGPVSQPLKLAEIRARLPEQVQIVQYGVLPDRLAIWLVSQSRFELIEKPVTAAALTQRVETYRALVIGKGSAAEIIKSGRELYDLLIPAGLDNGKQLCVISDTSLHQLAFASLVAPSGRYLVQDFALSFAPSASVLVLASENARRRAQFTSENLLSIGNPDFDREENPNLADLQAAEAEAKGIAGDYDQAVTMLGSEATRTAFLREFTKFAVVHFAGHFVANRQSPANSKLLFAGGDLRAHELGAFKLPRAKLFVLSACETGFERYNKSEGAIGIARTLLALGAPLVLASQWQVDSEPTSDLMIAFHANRKQKRLTSAESLRQAQLEMLSHNETRAPFYWAAFSLFGGYANY